jgi:hypothetical protein
MLAAALAALIEDYVTWKEGGKSLIDWSQWQPGIEYATKGIKSLGKISAICLIKLLNWGAQLPTPGRPFSNSLTSTPLIFR